jgi:hypothetical protein
MKLKEPKLAKLTDTQLIVLSKAAARDDGLATIPEGLNKAAVESWCKSRDSQVDARRLRKPLRARLRRHADRLGDEA